MARVIHNPASGERIVITTTGAETGGRLLAFDVFLPRGAHVPAGHVHPNQEERFTIRQGHVRFKIGRQTLVAGPNDVLTVPRGTPHWFGNAGPDEAHVAVEVRPALRMQELLETTATLSRASVPRLAAFLLHFERELSVPRVPGVLVRAALTPLAWLARSKAT